MANLTLCSRWTDAGKTINEVDAGSSIHAGFRVTFIHIVLTVDSLVTGFALQKLKKKVQDFVNTLYSNRKFLTVLPKSEKKKKANICTYNTLICALIVFTCGSIATWI